MTTPDIRPARPDELRALAAFIARTNALPTSQSLHCAAGTSADVRAALREATTFPDGWENAFLIADAGGGEIGAACGWQSDPARTHGWLWGPWMNDSSGWQTLAPTLLDSLLGRLPRSLRRVEAFLHAENRAGLRFLRARGFSLGTLTHLYVAPRTAWRPGDGESLAPLRPTHEVGFARLHAETFPASGSTPAEDLLAGRDEEHAIFAAGDGLRLLGYVCVSVNHAPREGFIEYLAVRPNARGRGVGACLLQTALRWTFDERRLTPGGSVRERMAWPRPAALRKRRFPVGRQRGRGAAGPACLVRSTPRQRRRHPGPERQFAPCDTRRSTYQRKSADAPTTSGYRHRQTAKFTSGIVSAGGRWILFGTYGSRLMTGWCSR